MIYRVCEKFGYTPDEVRAMDAQDVEDFIMIMTHDALAQDARMRDAGR